MNKVLDTQEYIIEPDTKVEDVVSFFSTVHWSMDRVTGLHHFIRLANVNKQCYKVFLKDNAPYIKILKEIEDGQTDKEQNG